MNVLIFEPVYTGHRCEYLARIIPAIQQAGATKITLVATERGFHSDEFRVHLSDLETPFERHACADIERSSLLMKTNVAARELEQSIRQLRPDHVYVPGADGISQILATRPWTGRRSPVADVFAEALHFRGAYGYRLDQWRRRIKSRIDGVLVTRAPWAVYYHLDPWQLATLQARQPSFRTRSAVMPDPVDPAAEISAVVARRELEIPDDGVYIGCAGPISRRKGADLLAQAFAAAQHRIPDNARLLLAGKFEPQVRELIAREFKQLMDSQRIVVIDRVLTPREMAIVIPAMDIVSTPYRDHLGSSGILLRAAAAHRPLLTANRHCMQRLITRFGLGRTCNVRDHEQFTAAVIAAFDWYPEFQQPESAARFLKFQSEENFRSAWTARLRQRLGQPIDKELVTWDWVMDAVQS